MIMAVYLYTAKNFTAWPDFSCSNLAITEAGQFTGNSEQTRAPLS